MRERFPRIYETCLRYGIDLEHEAAPVAPAAHYAMGGVWTDLEGRTSLPGLFAAGEVACTGVHGANRLASNSLLEGVVFGARAGRAMAESAGGTSRPGPRPNVFPQGETSSHAARQLTWEKCGIVRDAGGLHDALLWLDGKGSEDVETRNILLVAKLIALCALSREESRGAHYRTDFPEKRSEFEKHTIIRKNAGITFR